MGIGERIAGELGDRRRRRAETGLEPGTGHEREAAAQGRHIEQNRDVVGAPIGDHQVGFD